MTSGQVIAFLGYLGLFYAPLNSLTQMSTWFTQFTTQAHRVFEVLDQEPEIHEPKDAVDIEIQGTIEFKNITFGYDPHIPVLHDVSFVAHQGEMIGIVGHSGSGKSTTVNLITRFYDPREGQVLIDNVPITKIRKNCLRRQIGIVLQDPFLFRGTVADNISYGNPDVAPEQMLDAALAANAHMFTVRNHDGYDARLGESGSGLSGGERQRVAIARALLHNPRVLILDEATSSVDTIAEREIQKALEGLSLGRTVIAIAHRLSTLRNCDRILVFEEGLIREMGTHEELLALGGIYKRLVEIQTQ
ncbi:MAG: ABC transporter ATP-binding protein, partial [Gemmatimonadaceae bacterium]|nr:ABC transporter ATP-binding protein [Gemmatimonadaceae bacterium]